MQNFSKIACAIVLMSGIGYTSAQEIKNPADSLSQTEKQWEASVTLLSRYIWRGQAYGGDFPAVQPAFGYYVTERLSVGVWATTNFKKEDYYADGASKGYREFDFGLDYQLTDYLSIGLWDYYWPAIQHQDGARTGYFNFGSDGVSTIDLSLTADFSEGYRYPFNAAVSTFVAGNDFRYNSNGENPKQNFTTYAEVGYSFNDALGLISEKTFRDISIKPVVGAVLNNRAGYYEAADYDKISFINLSVSCERQFDLGHSITMPVVLCFTHNAAGANTETEGHNFLTATVALQY